MQTRYHWNICKICNFLASISNKQTAQQPVLCFSYWWVHWQSTPVPFQATFTSCCIFIPLQGWHISVKATEHILQTGPSVLQAWPRSSGSTSDVPFLQEEWGNARVLHHTQAEGLLGKSDLPCAASVHLSQLRREWGQCSHSQLLSVQVTVYVCVIGYCPCKQLGTLLRTAACTKVLQKDLSCKPRLNFCLHN